MDPCLHAANCNALGGEPLDAVSRIDSHSRLHLYSCSCDTVHAPVLSTTNAIGNDEFVEQRKRHFPRECTLLPSSSSRAFLAFFSASPLIAPLFFSTPPFVFYSLLPSLAFQPLRNVSLLNVPQNHSRIFPFFSSTTCFVSRNSCIPLCSTWFY